MEGIPNKGEQERFDELRVKLLELSERDTDNEIFNRRNAFALELKRTVPSEVLDRVRLWHLLIGSTVPIESVPQFDLPGGEIERFIRTEL